MNKKLLSLLQYVIFLGLGVFLIWLTVKELDASQWQMLGTSLAQARYWLLIPIIGTVLLSHWSRAVRWKLLMEPMGYKPGTANTFFAVMVGYLANLAVPRLGEVLKCTLLARYEKVPADKLIGTIVAERAFDLICLVIVITLTIVTQSSVIGSFASERLGPLSQGSTLYKAGWLVGLVLFVYILYKVVYPRIAHFSFVKKLKAVVAGIWAGLTSIRNVKRKGLFLFHTAFIWFLYLISIRIGFYAMESTEHLGIPEALAVLSFGSIAMIITPGGIGAYQYLIQELLMVYGLKDVEGLAFGWLIWGSQTAIVLLVGLLCIALLPYFNRRKKTAPAGTLDATPHKVP